MERGDSRMRAIPQRMCISSLMAYKRFVSPLLPHSCRFVPTCSAYAIQAIEKYGVIKGLSCGLLRLLRCHPFCRGGYDPLE